MKKLVLVLTMLLAFACSSMAFAADGGDLNKEQKTAEKMMTSLVWMLLPAMLLLLPH